jgi:glutamate dehydrogenase
VRATGESAPADPALSDVLALVDERLDAERGAAVRAFARAYLRRLGEEENGAGDGRPAEQLFQEISGVFGLAAGRGAAAAAVRAFTPTLAEHGYQPHGSVLETNTEDLPFLVDSVLAEIDARGLGVERVLHPIIGTERDAEGRIVRVLHPKEAERSESVMHFELDRRLTPEELAELEDGVRAVLGHVRRVVEAFPAMLEKARATVERARAMGDRHSREEVDEVADFLEWLVRDAFIFLGYSDAEVQLGLDVPARDAGGDELLVVAKSDHVSPVHKRAPMDCVRVDGATLLGLFTTRAYSEPASETPVLRRKLREILAAEDLIEGSHDYKSAVALFDSFPKDELFAAPTEDLRGALMALLTLGGDRVRLLARRHPDGHGASFILAMPRRRHTAALLERVREHLGRRLGGVVTAQPVLGDDDRARVHFTVHAPAGVPELDKRALEREVLELARTWDDRTAQELVAYLDTGEERGRMLAARWLRRLPESYKAATQPALAVHDILCFERLLTCGEDIVVGLQNEPGEDLVRTRVGLYKLGDKVELSRVMPILEDLGLRVIEERPTRLLGGDAPVWLQDFGVLGPRDRPLDLNLVGARLADTIKVVWHGRAESDSLNRLVITAGLDWGQVAILRAYRKYRQRIGSRFTEGYQNDVIAANPGVTAKLMRLFALRFDPARERDEDAEAALHAEILEDLEDVVSLDHDRILRNQLGLIHATVRTNAYKPGRRVIAFKLRSAEVPAIPQPPPLFEIYVYSTEVEGIHLRGGTIARGGIRWSDRMDYRTEVFGLMRAQMTKNAVIVPSGAKGGFYLKRPPAGPAALREEVERRYVEYVGGLLDVTDNLVDGETVHPDSVRVLDEDDAYLVVAADKGTARLSDTANAVAERRDFWLGDAFASGGSKGYDHKGLGITARGAWESLKRHFRELGMDPAVDEFTVVGIGDMSGDVFGNGMLLSDRIRLVAAYDHRHVFIDPDPDAARSFAERRRLFDLGASSWDDYDRELISEGGGVWPRSAKRVPLSPQARRVLGIEDEVLTPNEVIRAILRAEVDVLWNGGIGTVVKCSAESDDDAQDRSSDAIRVDARELRCRVVAEGGNLGFTQRARIEYTRGGGLIFADFIDNSAGVDCSDHEVNLKVLLGLAVRRGEMTLEERDTLLAEVTDAVATHVLDDSFLQAQILAQEVRNATGRDFAYEDLMASLEDEGMLDRAVEALPGSEEMAERRRAGRGMARPELAVLLAYAKRSLTDALLQSDLLDDPYLERDLRGYFPGAVVGRFGHLLSEHPLRRELLATIEANRVVNALGSTFVSRIVAERGAEPAEIARALRVAVEVIDADRRWDLVEATAGTVDGAVQLRLMEGVDWLVEATSRWFLAHGSDGDMGAEIDRAREGFERLAAALPQLGSDEWRAEREAIAAELVDAGVPEELARSHAFQPGLAHAPDMIAVAEATGRSVEEVGRTFYRVGDGLRLEWLERAILSLPTPTRMQRWAEHAALDDILAARRELAHRALEESPGAPAEEAVEAFLERRQEAMHRLRSFTRALSGEGEPDLAGLTLAVRQLRALVD